jgi:transposase
MGEVTTIAVDIAKRAFDLYWVDVRTGEICSKSMTRAKFEQFMCKHQPSVVVLEAGGSAHYWGRWLERQGHEARLIAPQHVRAFIRTNKVDRTDARAIWEAAHRPEMKWIALKSEENQAALALHRMREQLKRIRKMQIHQLKGLLYEFGLVVPALSKVTLAQLDAWVEAGQLPTLMQASVRAQIERIDRMKREERELERRIERHNETNELAMRLLAVPGIGTLGASALSAELDASAKSFGSARQFAACKGMAPRLRGSGGKVHTGAISKRGDPYVRTLLIHGARSVIARRRRTQQLSPWLKGLLERRPMNVVVVALANKMARTAWALAAHGRTYQETRRRASAVG